MAKQTEDELSREINEQYLFAKKYLDPVHTRMNEQEELYRTFIDSSTYPHNAMVFDPRIFRIIETITPRLVANEPTGSFYPVESGDVTTSQILNALIKYDWRRAEMFAKLVMFVKSMLIFGTAFGRCYWDFRERDRVRMKAKKINGRLVWTPESTETVKMTEFDGPNFETLNIYDCYPDPNATGLDNMRWFIYRTFKTLDELKKENETRGVEYYKNLDKLESSLIKEDNKGGSTIDSGDLTYREHRRMMLSTSELHGQDDSNPEFVVLRRFTPDGWVDYVPDHNIIIREIENPYFHGKMPIVYGVDYPYPGELFGMGEIEPVDRIQRAINAVLNQRLDNVQLVLRNMWMVRKNANVDLHTLISAPGNIITADSITENDLKPVTIPDVTGQTFVQTMNYLTASIQNGSGITDYTIGINTDTNTVNKTATGTRLIQQEANAQFKLKIQLFNHLVIQRIANQWKDLRIQYTTEEQKLRIVGKDEVKYLLQNTKLAITGMDGQEVIPGDMQTPTKLKVSEDQSFAFLNLIPDEIQPSIVGDYDFIPAVSSDQLNDPIAMQENFFVALEKVSTPLWNQGLATQQKQLNFTGLTQKVFEKLNLGLEEKDVIEDIHPVTPPEQSGTMDQPLNPAQINQMKRPLPELLPTVQQLLGGANGSANAQPTTGTIPAQ